MDNVKYCNFILHKYSSIIHNLKHKLSTMNRRLQKPFAYSFPLTHKVVRNCQLITEHIGDLTVEGVGYYDPSISRLDTEHSRYDADIDFVKWNGADIKPVLELSGMMDDIADATVQYIATLFQAGSLKDMAA